MFRELMGYCVTTSDYSGYYSFAMQHTTTATFIILIFLSGNVLHRVCLSSAPPRNAVTTKILGLVSSFLNLFDVFPTCISPHDVGEKLGESLSSCLPGKPQPTVVRTFGTDEFEKSLVVSTTQIIERHDYRAILNFMLMKLRKTLDRDLLKKILLLYEVIHFIV